jgi:hypothetical protein
MFYRDFVVSKKQKFIDEIEENGKLLERYPVDENMNNPNSGDAVVYLYKGKKYEIITWNSSAERKRGKTIYKLDDE